MQPYEQDSIQPVSLFLHQIQSFVDNSLPLPEAEQSLTRKTLKILFDDREMSLTELPGYPDVPIVLCIPEPDENLLRKT